MNRSALGATRTALILGATALLLAGCAAKPLRYVDPEGKEHSGTLNEAMSTMTADVDGKHYAGRYTVLDMWGEARGILTTTNRESLSCKFTFYFQKVAGRCTTPLGRSYDFRNVR